MAQSEIKRLTVSRPTEQQQLSTCDANDVPETLDEYILGQINQLQKEIKYKSSRTGERALIYRYYQKWSEPSAVLVDKKCSEL